MKIALTGAAGFIGSCMLWKLNSEGHDDIITVDRLDKTDKWKNLVGKKFDDYLDADDFLVELYEGTLESLDMIIHMGACSSTTLNDSDYYMRNNYEYTRELAEFCASHDVRFIYASSAATYGGGEFGFSDDDEITPNLRPLNMYGYSKHMFDLWLLRKNLHNTFVGLKYFNVYGPNEYHKKEMRSLICKRFDDVRKNRKISLFKSYCPDYKDGEQKRDFIYVKDAVDITYFFVENPVTSGIFNVGTGSAFTWNDIAASLFKSLNISLSIEYIDMPEVLKDKYQYFTEADITKLRRTGYKKEFFTLEDAVKDYSEFLLEKSYL